MNEPANHTAWVDNLGDIWVRLDEADRDNNWWTVFPDGSVAQPLSWREIALTLRRASPEQTTRALARVRQEAGR